MPLPALSAYPLPEPAVIAAAFVVLQRCSFGRAQTGICKEAVGPLFIGVSDGGLIKLFCHEDWSLAFTGMQNRERVVTESPVRRSRRHYWRLRVCEKLQTRGEVFGCMTCGCEAQRNSKREDHRSYSADYNTHMEPL